MYFVKYICYNILCYILNITNMNRHDRMADLQLTMKPVAITTNVVSSNAAHGDVYSIQNYVINLSVTLLFSLVLQFPLPIKLTATI